MTDKKCLLSPSFFSRIPYCYRVKDKPKARYCKDHGCKMCEYVEEKKGFMDDFGSEMCSQVCVIRSNSYRLNNNTIKEDEEEKDRRQELANSVEIRCNNLKEKIQEKYTSFYEQISKVDLGKFKGNFIRRKMESWKFVNEWHLIIDSCSLESDEKRQWKEIYTEDNCVANLAKLNLEETSFLLSLAKKKKLQEKKKKSEREEIIREIKQALNLFSPRVELKDLPEVYHNYESWENEKLKIEKAGIIEEIKNKREEKKLSALLIEANVCIDDELREFIRKLEKFTWEHASKHRKRAYFSQKVQVDTVISSLWDRLDDLNDNLSLISLRDDIKRNFDGWMKEWGDLPLPDSFAYRNFKENIESIWDRDLLLSQQYQAFQSIIKEFKNVVKKQVGEEKLDSESQLIDKGENFAEIKLAGEIVKLSVLNRENREELGSTREEFEKFRFIEGEVNKLKNLLDSNQEVNLSEVNALVEKLKEEIRNAKFDKSQTQEENSSNQSSWLSSHWKEIGVIIVFVFFLVSTLVFLIIKKKKRKTFGS